MYNIARKFQFETDKSAIETSSNQKKGFSKFHKTTHNIYRKIYMFILPYFSGYLLFSYKEEELNNKLMCQLQCRSLAWWYSNIITLSLTNQMTSFHNYQFFKLLLIQKYRK
jgi:hypothetical protein